MTAANGWCATVKRYVYFWADGIHVQARLEDDAQCLLVIIGATPEGKKELVGLIDGVRESSQSWKELLLDLKRRGLAMGPELAVADGALGFWKALPEVWPKTREQRCWVHKTANVLNKLPKSLQGKTKRALQDIWMAETRKDAKAAFDAFADVYGAKYDKAVECLTLQRAQPVWRVRRQFAVGPNLAGNGRRDDDREAAEQEAEAGHEHDFHRRIGAAG